MSMNTASRSNVIGIAHMGDDGRIIMELNFNNRDTGPKGISRLIFGPFDPAYWVIIVKIPHLTDGGIHVIMNDWETYGDNFGAIVSM